MPDVKRKSGWRNWAVNGCFLASGLMIGLKGGQSSQDAAPDDSSAQVASEADSDSQSPLVDAEASRDAEADQLNPPDAAGADLASSEKPSEIETDEGDETDETSSDTRFEWVTDIDSDDQADTTADQVAEQSTETESESSDVQETGEKVVDADRAEGEVFAEKGDLISDVATQLRSLSEEEMKVEKRQIAAPAVEKVAPRSLTEKTDKVSSENPVGKTIVIDTNEYQDGESKVAKQVTGAKPETGVEKNTKKNSVVNSNPIATNNAVAKTRKTGANQASVKPAYQIESIPPGPAEVITVRPAVQKNIRPVSTTQRAPTQPAKKVDAQKADAAKAKAVKEIENELQRLQRTLQELQGSSPSSRR